MKKFNLALGGLLVFSVPAFAQAPAAQPGPALSALALGQMLAEAQFREARALTRALTAEQAVQTDEQALAAANAHVTALEGQVKALTPPASAKP